MNRRLVRGFGALALAMSVALPVRAETLADALVGAYQHSGLLDQNRAVLRAADENVAQAVAALRPVLSWSAEISRSFGRTTSASTGFVSQGFASTTLSMGLLGQLTLYDGGANLLTIDAQKESVLATRASLVSVEQQVLLRAVQAFMEVRRAGQNVTLRQNNVRVIRQEVRAARDRFEVGEVTRTDVALAEARLSAARSSLAAAEGSLVASKEEYRAAVGRKPGALTAPKSAPHLPSSVDRAKAQAVRSHPDMIRFQHLVAANELAIQIARASMQPNVDLTTTLGFSNTLGTRTESITGSVGIEVTGPIYQGGRLSSLVRQAMANRDETRGNLHVVRHNVQQNVGNAFVQLRVARASRDAFQDQVRAARVAFQGVREEATLGARTTLDVLDAEQELLDAQASLIGAQVDEMIAAYTVLATIGELTARNLGLNVPQYDPTEYYNLVKDAPTLSKQGEQLDRVLKALGKD